MGQIWDPGFRNLVAYKKRVLEYFLNYNDKIQNSKNLTTMNMVITHFENRTLFCKNKLYEEMDAEFLPKN